MRFRVSGRTDDMFNVRGINIFPSAIQKVLAAATELTTGHFRIRLQGPGPYDRVQIRAEAAAGLAEAGWATAARQLEARIRDVTGASAEIEIIPFEALPRTDGKTSLIERIPA